MGFKEIFAYMKEKRKERTEAELAITPLSDDETRDKYLRSLRRQRRVQNEEVEKVVLKKQIDAFEKKRTQEFLFGMKSELPIVKKIREKQVETNLLSGKKQKVFKKTGWLGRGGM